MIIEKTNIDDVKLIKPKIYNDSRGYFFESFNQELSKSLNCEFIQSNESFSTYGVIRGIHFQKSPFEQPMSKTFNFFLSKLFFLKSLIKKTNISFGFSYLFSLR